MIAGSLLRLAPSLSSLLGPLLDGDPSGGTYELVVSETGPGGGSDQEREATA